MSDDALFETTPVPRLQPGDRVLVQTMWGQETGVVRDVHDEDGFPMVKVTLEMGDTASFDIAWVTRSTPHEHRDEGVAPPGPAPGLDRAVRRP